MPRDIKITLEPNGIDSVAHIPLGDTRDSPCVSDKSAKRSLPDLADVVIVDIGDYHRLVQTGWVERLSTSKAMGKAYPCYYDPVVNKTYSLAREMIQARDDESIAYKDGNPLNLRRKNIKRRLNK
jgi:hypothetical protein